MPWSPELESTYTLLRIYKEDSARLVKFRDEHMLLSSGIYSPDHTERIKYLKDTMQRFKRRIKLSARELNTRLDIKNGKPSV
jgi:hypothetical protein